MRKLVNKKDSSILIKIDAKTRERYKEYADANEKGMSEIIREHMVSDLEEYEQTGRRKKPATGSKDSPNVVMAVLYYATNILNSLEEMGIDSEDIEREVKGLWDIVG